MPTRCRSCRSTLGGYHGRPLINLKSGIAIGHDGLCQGCAVEIIGLAAIGLPSVAIGLGPEPEPLPENKPDDEDGAEPKEPPQKKPKVSDPDTVLILADSESDLEALDRRGYSLIDPELEASDRMLWGTASEDPGSSARKRLEDTLAMFESPQRRLDLIG